MFAILLKSFFLTNALIQFKARNLEALKSLDEIKPNIKLLYETTFALLRKVSKAVDGFFTNWCIPHWKFF